MLKLSDALRHAEVQNRYFSKVDLTVADNIPVIYHDTGFTPGIHVPGESSALRPAPHWQPRASLNNSLSDDELKAILSVDS